MIPVRIRKGGSNDGGGAPPGPDQPRFHQAAAPSALRDLLGAGDSLNSMGKRPWRRKRSGGRSWHCSSSCCRSRCSGAGRWAAAVKANTAAAGWRLGCPRTCNMSRTSRLTGSMDSWGCPLNSSPKCPSVLPA
ncbi:uncharacterized protein LOC100275755 isoform 2 [Zea mays]|uniref:Uncharacterized protein n=1 Tax=Zea mays TaxID=4577 RepID=C0PGV9_MAIZE|nr:uncharacterized protein LOC100275755 isoform 2 [Zea mays]ACN34425.1 unknown [Zea mays]ONM18228.1 hypothetical protein ZEAMMB73_Zm00001d004053 [Zea mays]ONM18229.1 hypothetical protein ZEAMMB73_Zm00001d004053 [Zea mays]ONM18235.1 hypothetical protein ZEAMMB73_Zm00001d004053 [Zea mays]ONM18236.1 hypothetical protein ZEAMMB73_Zm00001d004053 [Zea mays]